jgi:hypothetical protein
VAWRLTVRAGGRVEHTRYEGLDQLLDALEAHGRKLAASVAGQAVNLRFRRVEPAQQVTARLELAGPERWFPSVRAGVDIHADGSVEAFRGGIRRLELEPCGGEDAFAVLRRSLSDVLAAAGAQSS